MLKKVTMARKGPALRYESVSKTGYLMECYEIRYKSRAFAPERKKKPKPVPPRRPNMNRKAL